METGRNARKLLLIGSSFHASVVVDAIELGRTYKVVGYLDDTIDVGTVRRGYPVLGKLEDATAICKAFSINEAVIAIGDNWWRRKIYGSISRMNPDLKFPTIIHPTAIIAASAELDKGATVLAGAHIGPGSQVGGFCILNTGSSIDHDCKLRDFSSIAPGVFAGGLVEVGECTAVGVGASISDRISIGPHTVIGTGAVVVKNVPELVVAYGNPARVQRSRLKGEKYI